MPFAWRSGAVVRQALPGLLVLCFLALLASCQAAPKTRAAPGQENRILGAGEKPFLLMNRKDYRAVWSSISRRSQDAIVQDVLVACRGLTVQCSRDELRADFARGGPSATVYWENYLANFDPNTVLRDSRWSMGAVGPDEAEIIVRHKDADREAILKIVREDGAWKLGLEESFGVRKWMKW
jgi:hypothetical protein